MKPVTAAEMRALDEKAIREYGIPSIILMENAGLRAADEILKLLGPDRSFSTAAVFVGKGNNGGDGFVVARHLANSDVQPLVFYFQDPREMKPDPMINFNILKKMGVPLMDCSGNFNWESLESALSVSDLVVDALFGTGLSRDIEEPFGTVIEKINDAGLPVVALDIPSGLNADTGEVMGICVRASLTLAFSLPKKGFYLNGAEQYTGGVKVVDISLPGGLVNGGVSS